MKYNVGDTFKNSNNIDCIIIDKFHNGYYNYFNLQEKQLKGIILENVYDDRFLVYFTLNRSACASRNYQYIN